MESGAFKDAYIRLVTRTWSDDTYRDTVLADPITHLREAGFEIPEGATVRVDTEDYANLPDAGLDGAAEWWDKDAASGIYRIALPESAPVQLAELDERELEGLAGGVCCSCCCG